MKLLTLVFTLLILLICANINTIQAQVSRFSYNTYTDGRDTLKYRMLTPDADTMRKHPLVIFLHGAGERGSDNEAQLKWGVMNFATDAMMMAHPAIVIAPQCPPNLTWSNFSGRGNPNDMRLQPTPTKPMELVIALIRTMMKNKSVDTNRIYITGLSMGGFGTYDAIERYPNLFAAAMPVCGGGDVSRASSIADIPLWNFHGMEDPAVDPNYSTAMMEALMKAGARPGFTFYPEVGHFSWLAAYSDAYALEWLFRQHK